LGTEIQAGDVGAALGEGEGEVAGATAKVQRAGGGGDGREVHDATFPTAVEAEALEVVDKIVAAGDSREEVIDLGGAGVTRGIIEITHGSSLAEGKEGEKRAEAEFSSFALGGNHDTIGG